MLNGYAHFDQSVFVCVAKLKLHPKPHTVWRVTTTDLELCNVKKSMSLSFFLWLHCHSQLLSHGLMG